MISDRFGGARDVPSLCGSAASCSLKQFPDFMIQPRVCDKLPQVGKLEMILILQSCPSLSRLARQQSDSGPLPPPRHPCVAVRMSRSSSDVTGFFIIPTQNVKGGSGPGTRTAVPPAAETKRLLLKPNIFWEGFHITSQLEGPTPHQSATLK